MTIETKRLILREWKDSDFEPFAALNADPEVMEFFPKTMTHDETAAMIQRTKARYAEDGFCLWATEEKETADFIGFIGLARPNFEAKFTPCVEIGWRLARRFWGKGYAPEGALAVLQDGFENHGLDEIVSFTAEINLKSIRVMEKISMWRDQENDFMHPNVADGHRLKPHVLYRMTRKDWQHLK
jgi:RimJ/RimL family protein N-acetyltransferase